MVEKVDFPRSGEKERRCLGPLKRGAEIPSIFALVLYSFPFMSFHRAWVNDLSQSPWYSSTRNVEENNKQKQGRVSFASCICTRPFNCIKPGRFQDSSTQVMPGWLSLGHPWPLRGFPSEQGLGVAVFLWAPSEQPPVQLPKAWAWAVEQGKVFQ